ncbi:MAG: organomercurial lyase [Candidatus Heimdallarchaeota archaeon]
MSRIQINTTNDKVKEFLNLHIKVLENLLVGKSFEELKIQFSFEFDKFNYIALTKTFSMLSYDENDNLRGAYPISPNKTKYKVHVEGIGAGYAMCAIDALGVPYLFGKTTTIESTDQVTNEPIQFTIDPSFSDDHVISQLGEKFKELVITNPKGSEIQVGQAIDQAVDFCPYIGFVTDRETLTGKHLARVDSLDFVTALKYGKHSFGRENIVKLLEDFFSAILSFYQHDYLTGDQLVEQYIQNNELLLDTYSYEQIKGMLTSTLIKNGLIEEAHPSHLKEIYSLTPFGKKLMSSFVGSTYHNDPE